MESALSMSALHEVKTIWNRISSASDRKPHADPGTFLRQHARGEYATFMGAAPVIMGLLTGMFFGVSLLLKPPRAP